VSFEKAAADLKALQGQFATLRREFKLESLDASTQRSYKLFELEVERAAEEFRFRNGKVTKVKGYDVNSIRRERRYYHKCLVRFPACRRAFVLRKSPKGPALSEVTQSRMGEWRASCRPEVASRSAVPSVSPDF